MKYGQKLLQVSDAQTGSPFDPAYLASKNAAILASKTWIDAVPSQYDVQFSPRNLVSITPFRGMEFRPMSEAIFRA